MVLWLDIGRDNSGTPQHQSIYPHKTFLMGCTLTAHVQYVKEYVLSIALSAATTSSSGAEMKIMFLLPCGRVHTVFVCTCLAFTQAPPRGQEQHSALRLQRPPLPQVCTSGDFTYNVYFNMGGNWAPCVEHHTPLSVHMFLHRRHDSVLSVNVVVVWRVRVSPTHHGSTPVSTPHQLATAFPESAGLFVDPP